MRVGASGGPSIDAIVVTETGEFPAGDLAVYVLNRLTEFRRGVEKSFLVEVAGFTLPAEVCKAGRRQEEALFLCHVGIFWRGEGVDLVVGEDSGIVASEGYTDLFSEPFRIDEVNNVVR